MSKLSIQERDLHGVTMIDLDGRIALGETNRRLHETIRRVVSEGKKQIVLNLANVTYIDSSGLGEIVSGFTTLKANDGALKLVNVPVRVADLMTITKLYTVFDIYHEEIDAIYSFDAAAGQRTTQPLDAELLNAVPASTV